MNKKLIIGILIVGVGLILYKVSDRESVMSVVVGVPFAKSREYCFGRVQEATTDAPYRVEEHMQLSRVRREITGTKSGTQVGPDMTNGYEGTMTGGMVGDHLEFTYAYTIEGSQQKEVEHYLIDGSNLVKQRYVLREKKRNGEIVLVPDTSSTPTLSTYTSESCE